MKRGNQRRAADLEPFDQFSDPIAHLFGGFVRKGDGENVARPHAAFGNQIGDAVSDYSRLSRSRAGQNQQRSIAGSYGFALLFVELRKKISHEVIATYI